MRQILKTGGHILISGLQILDPCRPVRKLDRGFLRDRLHFLKTDLRRSKIRLADLEARLTQLRTQSTSSSSAAISSDSLIICEALYCLVKPMTEHLNKADKDPMWQEFSATNERKLKTCLKILKIHLGILGSCRRILRVHIRIWKNGLRAQPSNTSNAISFDSLVDREALHYLVTVVTEHFNKACEESMWRQEFLKTSKQVFETCLEISATCLENWENRLEIWETRLRTQLSNSSTAVSLDREDRLGSKIEEGSRDMSASAPSTASAKAEMVQRRRVHRSVSELIDESSEQGWHESELMNRDRLWRTMASQAASHRPSKSLVDLTPASKFPGTDFGASTSSAARSPRGQIGQSASLPAVQQNQTGLHYAHPNDSGIQSSEPTHPADPFQDGNPSAPSSVPGSLSHASDDTLSDQDHATDGVATTARWSEVSSVVSSEDGHRQ